MTDADPYAGGPTPAAQPTNGMAVASLVLGVLSILFVWIPFVGLISWVLAPIGLVLGLVALGKPSGRGLAIAGAICSGIGLLGCIGWVVLIGAVAAAGAGA
jgi:hypothetical protein